MGDKITPKQREALQAVADGKVSERNMGTAAFRIIGANPSVIGKLRSMGLIRWTKVIGGDAELTDRGREALPVELARERHPTKVNP